MHSMECDILNCVTIVFYSSCYWNLFFYHILILSAIAVTVPVRQWASTGTIFEARVKVDQIGAKSGQKEVETDRNGTKLWPNWIRMHVTEGI
jgi:hypothetical protein